MNGTSNIGLPCDFGACNPIGNDLLGVGGLATPSAPFTIDVLVLAPFIQGLFANNPRFTKLFLPAGFGTYQSCSVGNNSFYAPLGFDMATIEAAGRANGLNPFALNASVGQNGTFDFQRSLNSSGNTTFYSGFTNVSNFGVGVYEQSAGFPKWMGNALANGYALFRSSNFGDPNQALYRNLGFDTAAKGQVPACVTEPGD
jgi:hypothetical protein